MFFVSDQDEENPVELEPMNNMAVGKDNNQKKENGDPENNTVKPIVDNPDPIRSPLEELVPSNGAKNNDYPDGAPLPGRKMSVDEATEVTRAQGPVHLQSDPEYKDVEIQEKVSSL